MLNVRSGLKIYISLSSVDMRKAMNGLSALVVDVLSQSPQSGDLFLFFNKARDKVKLLFWDRNGFVLYYKRLERHKFHLPKIKDGTILEISEPQLQGLLAGFDLTLMQQFSEINYSEFY